MGAAAGNRDGLNRNLYEEICLLCVACGEKMRGRACRVVGAKPAAGVRLPRGAACCVEIAVGRQKAPQRSRRHAIIISRAPRYYRPRASACRNAPPAAWKSRSAGGRRRNDRASAPSRYGQRGRMAERTPPVGKKGAGVGGTAAAVGKRRRERDAELQIQTPRLTVRRYEKWGTNIPVRTTVGGRRRTSRSAVARKACVCARWSAVRGQRRHQRAGVGFFHPHPPSIAARGAGGAERRTDQFSVRFV